MARKLFGLAFSLLLTACLSMTPKGEPIVYGTKGGAHPLGTARVSGTEGGGHPLAASDVVAVFLSTTLVPGETKQVAGSAASGDARSIRPVQDKNAAYKALTEGFLSARSDVQVVVVDEPLHQACFDAGNERVTDDRAIFIRPDLSSERCRALVDQLRIRYFLSFSGWHATTSATDVEPAGLGVVVNTERTHQFVFVARAYDALRGTKVCGSKTVESGFSEGGGGIALVPVPLLPLVLPIPFFGGTETVDEPAFFARVAWLAGAKAGMCFVAPVKTEPKNVLPHIWCDIQGAGPDNRVWMTVEHCSSAQRAGKSGLGTDPWCLADPQANQPSCYYDTYEDCAAAKLTEQYRCISRE